jgi:S-methylmethionine-dependent homocysteine/selenocysteine methylase
MPRYRDALPHSTTRPFLTDGGIETTLIFKYGLDLPCFASFPLLDTPDGLTALRRYFASYSDLARRLGIGVVLESPTWRANPDWAARVGYSADRLAGVQQRAIALMEEVRAGLDGAGVPSVIAGDLGPRGDGYRPEFRMRSDEAAKYHGPQIGALSRTEADLVSALTISYPEEGIGIALAARGSGMPAVISFTVETDGRLPAGQSLREAIEQADAETDSYPAYYMVNCAHPSHLLAGLGAEGPWLRRIGGVRSNASPKSHAELDEATALDEGDVDSFGALHGTLRQRLPELRVIGGCCGTDHRHVERACVAGFGLGDLTSGGTH